jgi:hypothetical protein
MMTYDDLLIASFIRHDLDGEEPLMASDGL